MNNIFKTYDLKSLAYSLFAICAWPSNRSYVGACDYLNKNFLLFEEKNVNGTSKIESYEEFKTFFSKVRSDKSLPLDVDSSPIDIGQVHFFSTLNNSTYRIFIGTGSEDIYECSYLLEGIISENLSYKSAWKDILEYEDKQMSFYKGIDFNYDGFTCPSEEFFRRVQSNFDKLMSFNTLKNFFKNFSSENDGIYPFFSSKNGFPLFLPLMKECLFEIVESKTPEDIVSNGVWTAMLNSLFSVYSGNAKFQHLIIGSPNFLLPDGNIRLGNSFLVFNDESSILFCDENEDVNSLKKIIEANTLDVEGMNNPKQTVRMSKGINNIRIQFINTRRLSPNFKKLKSYEEDEQIVIDASSMIGILNDANSLSKIIKFISYLQDSSNKITSMTSIAGIFSIWQSSDEVISVGAGVPNLLFIPYSQVQCNIDFFKSLSNYPFGLNDEFSEPHRWSVIENSDTGLSLLGKEGSGQIRVVQIKNRYLIYQETEFLKEDMSKKNIDALLTYSDIVTNELKLKGDKILELLDEQYNEICIVSKKTFEQNCKSATIMSHRYSQSALVYKTKNNQILLISPQWSEIQTDNFSEKKRLFENSIFYDSIAGFFDNTASLKAVVHGDDTELRTTGVEQVKVPYFIKSNSNFSEPANVSFKKAQHIIADTIDGLKLSSGIYTGEESLKVIRSFRVNLREKFLELLGNYDRLQLHVLLMNIYSSVLFGIDIQKARLDRFSDDNVLDPEYQQSFKDEAVTLREKDRQYKLVLEYVIEENLLMMNRDSEEVAGSSEANMLIALAKWILDFQSQSDQVNYGINGWSYLEILEDHVVKFVETKHAIRVSDEVQKSKYDYGDYGIRDSRMDNEFWKKFVLAFEEDTRLNFNDFVKALRYISSYGLVHKLVDSGDMVVIDDVVKIEMDCLAQNFIESVNLSSESFYRCMKFITADSNALSNDAGVIPVWERKKRPNRISLQPVLTMNKLCIYSPVVLSHLVGEWIHGAYEFTLPYQSGMGRTIKVLSNWKKKYEDKIVQDLVNIFEDNERYDISYNTEIYKYDSKGNHPRNLGDYDLIVVDNVKKKVLLIEAKYMRMNLTVKETVEDQEGYFWGKKAKAKKFQRRIEYFKEHVNDIMRNNGYVGGFVVEGYFVANKIVRSFYEDYSFPILGFNEFKALIDKDI